MEIGRRVKQRKERGRCCQDMCERMLGRRIQPASCILLSQLHHNNEDSMLKNLSRSSNLIDWDEITALEMIADEPRRYDNAITYTSDVSPRPGHRRSVEHCHCYSIKFRRFQSLSSTTSGTSIHVRQRYDRRYMDAFKVQRGLPLEAPALAESCA